MHADDACRFAGASYREAFAGNRSVRTVPCAQPAHRSRSVAACRVSCDNKQKITKRKQKKGTPLRSRSSHRGNEADADDPPQPIDIVKCSTSSVQHALLVSASACTDCPSDVLRAAGAAAACRKWLRVRKNGRRARGPFEPRKSIACIHNYLFVFSQSALNQLYFTHALPRVPRSLSLSPRDTVVVAASARTRI